MNILNMETYETLGITALEPTTTLLDIFEQSPVQSLENLRIRNRLIPSNLSCVQDSKLRRGFLRPGRKSLAVCTKQVAERLKT